MQKDIEVRTLDGESTTVLISPDRSIRDLKAILKESFLPAKSSPNFHLFFKGAKLSLERCINSCEIELGEFIVLVPFAKKTQQLPMQHGSSDQSTSPLKCSHQSMVSPAADSTWLDIRNDLSCLSDISRDDPLPNCNPSDDPSSRKRDVLTSESSRKQSLNTKRKRVPDRSPFLRDILCSDCDNMFDQQNHHRFRRVLESVNCLSNSHSGGCLFSEEFYGKSEETEQCMCPSWLKRVLKSFTILNILYGIFQMQHKCMTRNCLEEVLKRASSVGLIDVNISDVENLSLLCPKVVLVLGKQENMITKLGSAIIIAESSTGSDDTARKQLPTSAVINAVKKLDIAFKKDLWKAIKCGMEKTVSKNSMPLTLPLEDLLISIKNGTAVREGSDIKSVKSRDLASGCRATNHLQPTEMVEHLRRGIGMHGQIVHVEEIDAKPAVLAELPNDLSETSKAALRGIGISSLYSHQAEAIQASLSGKNVVVATSTSSGKSLCYNLPVLEALSQNLLSCAFYLFPTKALAQDQLRALLEMTRGLDVSLDIGVYDGDTSLEDRTWIRNNARLLITNPDMMHMSILPFHRQFQRVLSNLRFIVIDEAHAYKGAFGCHTALILRRLRRICSHVYGSDPSFIFCTATSTNPCEHAMELANLQTLELIQNDGSPCGPKYFLLWNPPLCPTIGGKMRHCHMDLFLRGQRVRAAGMNTNLWTENPILEASYLFAEMVQHGLRCIAFCKTRKLSELVLCYTREILQVTASDLVDSICVYRAGYTPQDRRRIESDFFGGKLRGVAATNALELGIDVGHIDATLHLGFPGSVASLWQQAGRSGRRARPSLAVYVAFEGPLDQYFMKFPLKLFRSPIEHCQVDAHNQKVLEQHIACAALELPLCCQYDEKYFGSGLDSVILSLQNKGYLGIDSPGVSSAKVWSYIGPEERPSNAVSIRATETEKYKVIDKLTDELLEEIEESKAFFQVYEGAVYMHQGITYLVKALDLSAKFAFCQKADLKYYTKTRDYTDICVAGGDLAYPPVEVSEFKRTTAQANTCRVTTNWFGFYRIWRASNQIFDTVDLALPAYSYESQAAWIRVPQSIKTAVEIQEFSFRAGLHAASHALLNVVPLYLMCNASDLSTECANPHETRYIPERILLYDQHPGGIGISTQVKLLFRELLTAALELVTMCSCVCDAGCPNCVQTLSCHEYNEVIDKKAAIIILQGVIDAENSYFESREEPLGSSGAK